MTRLHRQPASPSLPVRLIALCLLAGAMVGCEHVPKPAILFGPKADADLAASLRQFEYPAAAPYGDDLDIELVVSGNTVTIANRTARAYRDVQLWLNQQHVTTVGHLPIGSGHRLQLSDFINEHGEPFPVGGFLNPDRSYPVVLAELYDPDAAPPATTESRAAAAPVGGRATNDEPTNSEPTNGEDATNGGSTNGEDASPPRNLGVRHRLIVRPQDVTP